MTDASRSHRLVVVASVLAVTLYKIFAVNALQCGKDVSRQRDYTRNAKLQFQLGCSLATAFAPSFMNTCSTMILGTIYSSIVVWLTEWGTVELWSGVSNT